MPIPVTLLTNAMPPIQLGYNDGNYCDVINIDNQGYLGFGHEFRAPQAPMTPL